MLNTVAPHAILVSNALLRPQWLSVQSLVRMSRRKISDEPLAKSTKSNRKGSVQIFEVGPRDGLQNESRIVSVSDKVKLINMLTTAGCTKIEGGSFVSPKMIPSMANTAQVMQELSDLRQQAGSRLTLSCLVPNVKYMNMAIEANVDEIAIFASASETFSQRVSDFVAMWQMLHDTDVCSAQRISIAVLKSPWKSTNKSWRWR
jgi:HMGL-like